MDVALLAGRLGIERACAELFQSVFEERPAFGTETDLLAENRGDVGRQGNSRLMFMLQFAKHPDEADEHFQVFFLDIAVLFHRVRIG
jgi:hypothetical protein